MAINKKLAQISKISPPIRGECPSYPIYTSFLTKFSLENDSEIIKNIEITFNLFYIILQKVQLFVK